jgi:hypothetical protein
MVAPLVFDGLHTGGFILAFCPGIPPAFGTLREPSNVRLAPEFGLPILWLVSHISLEFMVFILVGCVMVIFLAFSPHGWRLIRWFKGHFHGVLHSD